MMEVVANEGGEETDEITFCKLEEMVLCHLPNPQDENFLSGPPGYTKARESRKWQMMRGTGRMTLTPPSNSCYKGICTTYWVIAIAFIAFGDERVMRVENAKSAMNIMRKIAEIVDSSTPLAPPMVELPHAQLEVSRVINSGKPSVTVFHSGHLPHLPILSGHRIVVRKHSPPAKFSGDVFFRHRPYQKERLEEISNFCEGTGTKSSSTRRPRAIFRPATASHTPRVRPFPATRLLLQLRLTPTSLPTSWFSHPSPARTSFGDFCLRRPSKQSFRRSSGYFFSTPIPAHALGSVLLPFWWYHRDLRPSPFFGGATPQSEAVLGLSSIQTYFILQISGYGY
ncbi:hypothetical protein CK203_037976 [Vitis vinifera]|uniref:Uncharacterized protein n=1 Tax=Vitis vinifera TaxID=29760 RepID=A0A438HNP9_VITVI|nr:hypothetical protein CK203_037976 [Vitis vinifera]